MTATLPDAPRGNLVDRIAPAWMLPYARLARWDRPVGWWLLLLPCWLSAALAAGSLGKAYPDPWQMVLFLIGAIAMRGAGCTFNDIVDRDLDAGVARTRSRPIPSGQVSVRAAALFLALQAFVGLAVVLQFDAFTRNLALASLALVAIYPFLKRVTDWPQLGLGLVFSWGALVGWTSETGALGWAPVLLYAGCVAWTIGYDTIYALQDREDDALIGVRSTALLFGARVVPAVAVFYVLAAALWTGALFIVDVRTWAWVGLIAAVVVLAWQVLRLRPADGAGALSLFRANRWVGLSLLGGLLVDAVLTRAT